MFNNLKYFIYLLLVTLSAFSVYVLSADPQSCWTVWLGLSLALINLGNTFFRRVLFLLLTGIIVAISATLATIFSFNIILLAMYVALIVGVSVFLMWRFPPYFLAVLLINIFTIIASSYLVAESFAVNSVVYILLGTGIASFWQIIFWPYFIYHEQLAYTKIALNRLQNLSQTIFSCLEPEYGDNIYLFEKRLHDSKYYFMQAIFKLRAVAAIKSSVFTTLATKLDVLYDMLLNCAQLRFRVTDFTIFSICNNEIQEVAKELNKLFAVMNKHIKQNKFTLNTIELAEKIKRLEENYQHVLQVTAREPAVFFLFIEGLKELQTELGKL